MTDEWNDDDLTRAFADMRAHDARTLPPFAATLEAARARATASAAQAGWRLVTPSRWLRVAATLAIVAGGSWFALHTRTPLPSSLSLSEWRSPTAVLLEGATDPLLHSAPRFPTTTSALAAPGTHGPPRSHP